jgi:DNA-binding LacI/PurR family transcriptional regulator
VIFIGVSTNSSSEREMPSIKDVARYVGYSTSTVSRVINQDKAVSPTTRKKILRAIGDLGYKPNLIAQGLRVRKGRLIGLAVPEGTIHAFSLISQFALEAARGLGFNIIIVNTHEDPDLEKRSIEDLLRRNINGIILSRVSDESRIVRDILRQEIPIVVIDRAFEDERVSNVVLNNHRAGQLAGEHLLSLGHTRIACVTGSMNIALCRERLKGFRGALQRQGIELPDRSIFEGTFDYDSGILGAKKFADSGCTAIWAMNDIMAYGVLKQLHRQGIRVPEDISLMGMDDSEFAEMITPSLTTVHYPLKELAETAVAIVVEQVEAGTVNPQPQTVVLEPRLTIRESTGRCRELPQ